MRAFLQFIKKEFLHIFRDYRTLLVLFGMPPAQLLIFGYAIRTELNDANICIYDKSKDYVTMEITNKILSNKYFKLNGFVNSEKEIDEGFKSGKFKLAICFEPEFGNKLRHEGSADVQLLIDASDPDILYSTLWLY